MKPIIGYIGLGVMGNACANNLLKAGYPLHIYARRPEQMQGLIQAGAQPSTSPQNMAQCCDIIFTNVSDTSDVQQVILGEQGVILGAKAGSVVVDMSTILPSASRQIAAALAEKNIEMLDAPVSGGSQGAIDGTLSIMVGGKAEVFQRILPVLQVMGKNIVHIGDSGAGQVAKACNQIIVTQTLAAIAEAFTLATAAGVDAGKVRQALLGGFAGSRMLDVHGQRMLTRNYTPGFKAQLHQKDMQIVQQFAAEQGVDLPSTDLVTAYINALVEAGLGEQDSAAMGTLFEQKAGVNFGCIGKDG
ncbi:NAD(P)-dependent oxidoreductase [Sulfuriferula nivalis]|uniref:Tartronate semialdehyde reductase n=1 Tax=Sulfuriferula nivalis TaxID=2675298 RepID=A0A809RH08_9PROT|nr:NAD(P)-binding domain-containing protein [Sulfuriferula nivalis]BBP00134.1 tartronate semialdehyde reductase [Sulfuriferula nivalis]